MSLIKEYKQANGHFLYLSDNVMRNSDRVSDFISKHDSEISVIYKKLIHDSNKSMEGKSKVEMERKILKFSFKNKNWRKKSKGHGKHINRSSESSCSESIGTRNSNTSKSNSKASYISSKHQNKLNLNNNLNKSCNVETKKYGNTLEKEDFSLLKEKRERKKYHNDLDNLDKLLNVVSENRRMNSFSDKKPRKAVETINLVSDDEEIEETKNQNMGSKEKSETSSDREEGEIRSKDNKNLIDKIFENTTLTIKDLKNYTKKDFFQKNNNTNHMNKKSSTNILTEDLSNMIEEAKIKEINNTKKKVNKQVFENLVLLSSSDDDSIDNINKDLKMFNLSNEIVSRRMIEINNEVPIIVNMKSLSSFNYSLSKHLNLYKVETLYECTKKRINLVLDLDMTIVYSEEVEKISNYSNRDSETVYTLNPFVNDRHIKLYMKLRRFSKEMLKKLSYFCDFYVYTHGRTSYANEVIRVIKEQTGVEFKQVISSNCKEDMNGLKTLERYNLDDGTFSNTIILDDNVHVWSDSVISNIVNSMKYIAFNEELRPDRRREVYASYNYLYKISNLKFEFKEEIKIDENNSPLWLEYEFSKKFQLEYITELIENSYKLSIKSNKSIVESINDIQSSVLSNCLVNLDFTSFEETTKETIKKIVRCLGGKTNQSIINSTHFIITENRIKEFKENSNLRLSQKKVFPLNLKWIIHCYFFYKKMDEKDREYKIL